jgi:diguanylate cyclase (GGDEF)-like protein
MFDPWTLWAVLMAASLILALAMLFAWWMTPTEPALAHWAGAMAMFVLGVFCASLRGSIPDFASVALGNSALLVAYGLIWTGMRRFDRRSTRVSYVLIGPAIFVVAFLLPPLDEMAVPRVVLMSVLIGILLLLALEQLWRGDAFASRARTAMIAILTIVLALNLFRILVASTQIDEENRVRLFSDPSVAGMGLVALALAVFLCFSMVLMVRERTEMLYRSAAQRDELTGLFNRRGFMELSLAACLSGGPLAVMILDLDHFKRVNDRFGHLAGDRVLKLLAQVLRDNLRQTDIIGRIGGEEFAAVLPGATVAIAQQAAERVQRGLREGMAQLSFGDGAAPLQCTASIGLAIASMPQGAKVADIESRLLALIGRADAVLYQAKSAGRNRIEIAVPEPAVVAS